MKQYYHTYAIYKDEFIYKFHKFFTSIVASKDILVMRKIPTAVQDLDPGHSAFVALTYLL
jgi:hypothetical protein